jgi:hypothetical protein
MAGLLPKSRGLHHEEVHRQDPLGLGAQELAPGSSRSRTGPFARSSVRIVLAETPTPNLASSPRRMLPPRGVLSSRPEDEFPDLLAYGGSAARGDSFEGPLPSHELAMPAKGVCGLTTNDVHRARGTNRLSMP